MAAGHSLLLSAPLQGQRSCTLPRPPCARAWATLMWETYTLLMGAALPWNTMPSLFMDRCATWMLALRTPGCAWGPRRMGAGGWEVCGNREGWQRCRAGHGLAA